MKTFDLYTHEPKDKGMTGEIFFNDSGEVCLKIRNALFQPSIPDIPGHWEKKVIVLKFPGDLLDVLPVVPEAHEIPEIDIGEMLKKELLLIALA